MIRNELTKKIERISVIAEMLKENLCTYSIAKGDNKYGPYAGCSFPKNSNISKTALKKQIVILRNELLLLENLL